MTKHKASLKAIILAFSVAVFCLTALASSAQAQTFKHDFLYKFLSRWTDVTTDGSFFYVTNSAYSQIEKYVIGDHSLSLLKVGAGSGTGQLKQPMGIAIGTAAVNVYVADTGNDRIQKFDDSLAYVDSFGSQGAGPMRMNKPEGVAVDEAENYIFVADTGNNRIHAIKQAGKTFTTVGTLGNGNNQFSSPKGIAVYTAGPNEIRVYVADTGNNRIVYYRFDPTSDTFTFDSTFGTYGTGNGQFIQPNKITIDRSPSPYIYVTDSTNRVQKFNNGRAFDTSWNVVDSKGTTGITTFYSAPNTVVYVIEPYNQIDYYSSSGGFSQTLTNEVNEPVDVAVDTVGNIYMNNNYTNTVTKFNSSWVPQLEWGADGGTPFSGALGIGVNTGGEVCVADTGNNRIQRFNPNGTLNAQLPDPVATPVGFNNPSDVATEDTGKMYIADTDNNRILKYSSLNVETWGIGFPTPTWEAPPGPMSPTPVAPTGPFFYHPYGITVDPLNKIYIADSGFNRIQKFDANGNWIRSWGEFGSADNRAEPQFDDPQGMAIGPEPTGYIYVADTGNNRIQRFDQDGLLQNRILWGDYGTQDGYFNQPRNVAVDSSTRVYVSEVGNQRIQVFGDATLNAGASIVESNATAVTEDGSVFDSYTIRLYTQPSSNVVVTVASSDPSQVTVSTPTLTFTPENWNVPQVETVIPVRDWIDQPTTQHFTITHTAASSDTNYAGKSLGSVDVNLTDTDTAGVTVSPTGLDVWESGTGGVEEDTYDVNLQSKPTAAVTLTATSTDGYTTLNPSTCTILPSEWVSDVNNKTCTFTVKAFHDEVANGPTHEGYVSNTITTADTSGYQGMVVDEVLATVHDGVDEAGVIMNTGTVGPIDEGGTAGTFTVKLKSKPTAAVSIDIKTDPLVPDVTAVPGTLTFTPATWNMEQTVSLQAVRDFVFNTSPDRDVFATASASTGNTDPAYAPGVPFYVGITGSDGTVTVKVHDVDSSGVDIVETDGIDWLVEGQTFHTYSIALHSKPTGNVIITSSSDSEATTSAYVHKFTPTNWNIPQEVTITAPNNNIYEGTHSAVLSHVIEHSDDSFGYPVMATAYTFNFTIYDTDFPGIVFTLPNGVVNIQEGGYDDQYYMHLKTQPLANVDVGITGGGDATITPFLLSFTPSNWNVDQIATVSAINNFIVQGAHTGILTHTALSTDPGYNNLSTQLVINIADDDNTVPGVQVTQTNGETKVAEGSLTGDTYTLQLTSRPTANVRIRVLSDNWEATTSAGLFTFTPTNWSIPQTVNVVAKDDANLDGTKTSIFRHIVTSLDPHYNYMPVDDVYVIVEDNDFTTPAKAPSCNKTPPADIPNLFQIDSGANSATLYFTPLKDNIDYYFIAYGYKPGDVRFGVSFPYGAYDGVIDYTINMLNPSTTYYYKVRGGNGCATGNWSNTMAATTMASGSASLRTSYAGGGTAAYSASYGGTSTGGSSFTSGTSADGTHPIFARDMYLGTRGADVRSLQIYLNQKGFIVAQSGAGSPGNETDYYGPLTSAAIRRFQEAHYAEILSPLGYSSGTGIFGPSTRAYVNAH